MLHDLVMKLSGIHCTRMVGLVLSVLEALELESSAHFEVLRSAERDGFVIVAYTHP